MAWTCLGILVLLSALCAVNALRCLSCTDAHSYSHECRHNYTTCNPPEQCFLEQIRNADRSKIYSAGCRSTHLCNLIHALGGDYDSPRRRDATHRYGRTYSTCSECCATGDDCNNRLCLHSHHTVPVTPAPVHTTPVPKTPVPTTPRHPIQCIACNEATDIKTCRSNIVTCGQNEDCFIEVSEDEHDVVRYNAGCRNKLICSASQHSIAVVGRRKRERALDCFGCCSNSTHNHMCNAHLCGVDAPEVECLACGLVSSVGACHNTTFCQPTEVCYNSINIIGSLIRYFYSCETKYHCNAFIANGGVAGVTHGRRRHDATDGHPDLCSSCCSGTLCNKGDCYKVAANMTHFP